MKQKKRCIESFEINNSYWIKDETIIDPIVNNFFDDSETDFYFLDDIFESLYIKCMTLQQFIYIMNFYGIEFEKM